MKDQKNAEWLLPQPAEIDPAMQASGPYVLDGCHSCGRTACGNLRGWQAGYLGMRPWSCGAFYETGSVSGHVSISTYCGTNLFKILNVVIDS